MKCHITAESIRGIKNYIDSFFERCSNKLSYAENDDMRELMNDYNAQMEEIKHKASEMVDDCTREADDDIYYERYDKSSVWSWLSDQKRQIESAKNEALRNLDRQYSDAKYDITHNYSELRSNLSATKRMCLYAVDELNRKDFKDSSSIYNDLGETFVVDFCEGKLTSYGKDYKSDSISIRLGSFTYELKNRDGDYIINETFKYNGVLEFSDWED